MVTETLKQLDISVEVSREYVFADGFAYSIKHPVTLYTRPGSDSHRVVDDQGIAHYIPAGWRIIRWQGPVIA
jgi:hypothetical protein